MIPPKLPIIYQDDDIVAVYKPAGLVVHRCDSTPEGEVALLQLLRDQIGRHLYPVHRIDQPTSGIVLYGLSSLAAAALVDQFTNRRILKCYQAVVIGHFAEYCSISTPLSSTPLSASESTLAEGSPTRPLVRNPMRNAETHIRLLAHFAPNWKVDGGGILPVIARRSDTTHWAMAPDPSTLEERRTSCARRSSTRRRAIQWRDY